MIYYTDRDGNIWRVWMAEPDQMPINEGYATHHWKVAIEFPSGGRVMHGHQNLAAAIAGCVEKADQWKRGR